jgi:phosphate transport system substrate-binding protein
MKVWSGVYHRACPHSTITYQKVNSQAGLDAFVAGRTAFGGADVPLTGDQKKRADVRCGGSAVSVPLVLGPIAVIYSLAGVDTLQLSPVTLARIFNGRITRWDDPAIRAENPTAALPASPIYVVHRQDGSGTTQNFAAFLAWTAGRNWPYRPTLSWPVGGGPEATGNDGIARAVRARPGAIGYAELYFAEDLGLSTARIRNAAGEYVAASAQAAAVALSLAHQGAGDDLSLTFDYGTATDDAYPLYLVSYEAVCRRGPPSPASDLVRSFLAYASSPIGQQQVADIGYAALPANVASRVRAAIASLS